MHNTNGFTEENDKSGKKMGAETFNKKMFPQDAMHKDEKFLYVNNGGRRMDDPDTIAKKIFFWNLKESGFNRQEIIAEMEISTRSYSRYVESLDRIMAYCERLSFYPSYIPKNVYFNRYKIMASYLRAILESEKADQISDEWKEKAKEKIKSYEKLAALETKDVYKLFRDGMFDDIALGYSSMAFDWLIEKHRSQEVRTAAKLIKEDFLRHFKYEMRGEKTPQEAEEEIKGKAGEKAIDESCEQ